MFSIELAAVFRMLDVGFCGALKVVCLLKVG